MSLFAENLKAQRKKADLSQEKLGELIGVSGVAIMRYEKGLREPRLETIQKIADALNVSINDLMVVEPLSSFSSLPQEMYDSGDVSTEITFSSENFSASELDKLREYSEFLKYLRTNSKPPTTE